MTNEEERKRCIRLSHEDGDFVMGEDGYYVFWPNRRSGSFGPWHLRWIADELDRLNADYHKQVHEYFDRNPT